jgi:Eco57I restriction-modification methylase
MARAHRKARAHALAFDALTIEGALIAPAMLAQIAALKAAEQDKADYAVPKGLELRDEIARYFRIGQALFAEFAAAPNPSHRVTVDFIQALLRDVFGFSDIARSGTKAIGERAHLVTLEARGGRVPIVVVPPADELDRSSPGLSGDGRRRSAASTLQDWLNASEGALWGLATNGNQLRLMRDNSSLTRPAFIEADLRHIFRDEAFSDFAALWLIVHATRFGLPGSPVTNCALERWREAGAKEGETARDRLRDGVEAALLALGGGFLAHPDSRELRARIGDGKLPQAEFFSQLLRLVYRLIFLFAAEDRDLLHAPNAGAAARKVYAEGYSLNRLRERAVKRRYRDRHHDQWEGMIIVFAALAHGEPVLGLPALDGLFARGTLPDLEGARLANRDLMEAIYRLAWLNDDSGPVPVNWRDMQTEELGSVYESLLELTPQIGGDARSFAFAEGAEAKGHARKTSGSYYTPDSLVQLLLDSALDPVLDRVMSEADDPAKALLSVTVIDPACGSGHFLLAAARRIAARLAKLRAEGLASAEDFRHALRDVVRACIHGVDRNPMAVELAKVALWIETVDPGKPLGFLDANIRCGDALFGIFDLKALQVGIPAAAYKPLSGDDKDTAKYFEKRNKAEREGQGQLDFGGGGGKLPPAAPLADTARKLRAMPEDSPEEIAAKRKRFEAGRADPRSWNMQIAADLYTAAFLAPKMGGVPTNHNSVTIPTSAHVWEAMAGHSVYGPLVGRAQELSGQAHAFHWPLEFPDVMVGDGFDAVLGNPPWERIKLQEQEFFASREPEIAEAANAAARGKQIVVLKNAAPGSRQRALYDEFELAKRSAEASSEFARVPAGDGGRFPLTGRGDVNTYALFAEMFAGLVSPRGRAGVVVPTGIATDATTANFFEELLTKKQLFSLHDFQTGMGYFDRIGHARFKFCLLTIGRAGACAADPEFSFFSRTIQEFGDRRRHFTLSEADIAAVNPNTMTVPIFRTARDAELTAKVYREVPILLAERVRPGEEQSADPWGVAFMAMFHMANDSELFRTAEQLKSKHLLRDGLNWVTADSETQEKSCGDNISTCYLPLYEAKLSGFYDHRASSYGVASSRGYRVLPPTTVADHEDVDYEIEPFYWVSEREVRSRLNSRSWTRGWLLAWRDITHATNERTLIASVIPKSGSGDTLLLILPSADERHMACLFANMCSIVTDYVVRQKIGGLHLKYNVVKQIPLLAPSSYSLSAKTFIVPRVLELTYTSRSVAPFARDLGYEGPPFKWEEGRRALLRAELDAWYARAYGLTRDELRYILDPAAVMGPDYPSETFRVLKKNEIAKYGEYRTQKLVLQAWDRLERGELK